MLLHHFVEIFMDGAHGLVGAVLPQGVLNEGVEHFLLLGGGHGLGTAEDGINEAVV